jgi:hypothetical protein
VRNAGNVTVLARGSASVDDPTAPDAVADLDRVPDTQVPAAAPAPHSARAARWRAIRQALVRRAVVVPVACVLALVVGFASVTALLSRSDDPAKAGTKTPATTAAVPAPPPSAGPRQAVPAPTPAAPAPASAADGEPAVPTTQSPAPVAQAPAPASTMPPTSAPSTSVPTTSTPPPTTPSTTTP